VGWAVVVHTDKSIDKDGALAERLASEMANHAWQQREAFWHSERVEPAIAAAEAVVAAARGPPSAAEEGQGLLILSDTGDSTYGGAPGDSTCVARALLEALASSNTL
jgi:microcystin degradation protein MlrC